MSNRQTVHMKIGARIFAILFVLLFFILAGRFVYIQTVKAVDGHDLSALAESKWVKERTIEASRGQILDRNGEVIAKDVPTYTIYAILDENYSKNSPTPLHVVDKHETAVQLAPLLNMDVSDIERILNPSNEDVFQVEFGPKGRNLSYTLMEKIKALQLPGINFYREKKRLYPNGVFASHIVGFAIPNENGKLEGKMGIEQSFDELLQGKDGRISYQSDRSGLKLPNPKEMVIPPENGKDIYLTIDQKIQTFLENAMTDVEEKYNPDKIIGIVANAKTGEILAMGTRPSFDPNIRDVENYINDAISYRYEPGSTMKVFTLAAAIDAGVFQPNETYQSGSYRFSEKYPAIHDHNRVGWGEITYLEGIQRSSNVAVAKLVNEKLGTEKFYDYLLKFRFDQPTGIDLPQEVAGNILYRYPIEKITTAFGQGTTVTPIQQIQAATAISNGGKMLKPYIIEKIVDPKTGEVLKQQEPTVVGQPIKAETAKQVLDILETTVSQEAGTGKPYRIEGYDIAGKTGTAQIPDPETGQYMYGNNNYIYSFLGFVPKEDPQFIVYVSVKQPNLEPTELGSAPVSQIFKTVMKNTLHYMNIMPTAETTKEKEPIDQSVELPNVIGKSVDEAIQIFKELGIEPSALSNTGKITKQIPLPKSMLLPGEKVLLRTDETMIMPDMTGWALRDVLKMANAANVKVSIIGKGYVTKQSIQPNTEVQEGDYLVIELKPPYVEETETSEEELESLMITNEEDEKIFEQFHNVQD